MAIDERVTTLYLKVPSMDLSHLERLYKNLGECGFSLYPTDNPHWAKFESNNGISVKYVIESAYFPTFFIKDKDGKKEIVRCDFKALIIPSDEGMSPESRQIAENKLKDIVSGLELEVVQEETK